MWRKRDSTLTGYRIASCCSNYGGIRQRWLVGKSEKRTEFDFKKLTDKIEQKQKEAHQHLKALNQEKFACKPDAERAAIALNKKLRYHRLAGIEIVNLPYYAQAGRQKKVAKPDGYHYQVRAGLELKEDVVETEKTQAGRLILATNVLEDRELSDDEMFAEYKNQQSTERG